MGQEPQAFDSTVTQIEAYIKQLRESQHPDDARLMLLKGFIGAIAGAPELLEQIDELSQQRDCNYNWEDLE